VVRKDLQGGTRRDLLSVFLLTKYIHSCSFYLLGSVNKFLKFCVVYFPCCFLKMAIKISHSHFVHVAFVSILVFQTFDWMIFGTLTFRGTRWYVMTVWDTQMVRDQKKFENHCSRELFKPSRLGKPSCHNVEKIFLVLFLCEWRHQWSTFRPLWSTSPGPGPKPLVGSILLKFFLETRVKSESCDSLADLLELGFKVYDPK